MAQEYRNEEKQPEEIHEAQPAEMKNIDKASRRMNVSRTGTFKVGVGTNTAGIDRADTAAEIVYWAGATQENKANAPFRVDAAGNLVAQSVTIDGVTLTTIGTFGGDGSDGALSISSGTTTINLGGEQLVVKNYTSISITGTGKLAFSNPHASGTIIVIKSQGAVTLTSTQPAIDASGMGATGGAGGTTTGAAGTNGTNGTGLLDSSQHYGLGGNDGVNDGGLQITTNSVFYTKSALRLLTKSVYIYTGSGGGGGEGGQGDRDGGAGGRGGGGLLIECAGDLNFTGSVSVAGANGSDGEAGGTNEIGGGGGGGGSAGSCVILYNTATATSGTVTATGGTGGTGGGATSGGATGGDKGSGGGGGGSYTAAGGRGGSGNQAGTNAGGLGAGGGGSGGCDVVEYPKAPGTGGSSEGGLVIQNKYFA